MTQERGLATAWLLGALLLLPACTRGGGDSGPGPGPGPIGPARDWGPIPPGPRGPGEVVASPPVAIEIINAGPERTETLRASVPFAWGAVSDPGFWSIDNRDTAWLVLQRWPDRSVRIAQAQWTETLAAASTTKLHVEQQPAGLAGAFVQNGVFAGGLPELGAEVTDAFGVVYEGAAGGPGETLQETALVRVRRWRAYHVASSGGIGRDYLTSTFYVTELRDQPVVLVDWILGNDYLGADDPGGSGDPNLHALGGVDVDSARFRCRGFDLAVPFRPATAGIGSAVVGPNGFTRFETLTNTYLSDGQTKRYRFLLLRDDPAMTPAQQAAARTTAQAMMEQPLHPLADHASLRATHALGLLGGPGPAPGDAAVRAAGEYDAWQNAAHFGPWGSRGDPKLTTQTGTPRNHPLSPDLAHAVQSRDPGLLTVLEQKAWIQAARPYHLHGLRVGNADQLFLWDGVPLFPGSRDLSIESLGRRALRQNDPWPQYRTRVEGGGAHAHGFAWFDIEHWSMDVVFDYWTVSGDAWAADELRQLGESLRGLLRPHGFFTSDLQEARSEGWVMQGLVQAFLATDDIRFRDAALDRLHDIVDRDRSKNHPSRAVKINGTDPRTGWPEPHAFYMPWQHGPILFGYLAGWKFFGDELYLTVCDDVTRCVEYGWVQNVQQAPFGFVPDGLRFYVPTEHDNQPVPPSHFDAAFGINFGDEPLGGANSFLLAGLLMHARTSNDAAARARALQYGELLLQAPVTEARRWNKWFYCVPAEWLP